MTAYFLQDSPPETKAVAAPNWYEVVKVTDGDTITVKIDGQNVGIRMIGLNTPETVDPRTTVQCFGREASNKAKEMLTGQTVRLEADATQDDKDKYDRLLRYVYMSDGTLFNKWMVENGFGFEYTYDSNPYQYQAEFKAAEKSARESKRGLWADSTCSGKLKSL